MKFSTYQPAVGRNVMNPPAVQAPRDAMAFGTNGKEWDGLSAGLGQVIKVAQKEQDEADYMSAMKAKNDIRAKIMDGVYGEGGLFETGVGENAAGLTDRVTELVQKTYQEEGSKYNGRVQRLLLGDYNENTMNLQRISSSKEMSEREKLVDENYGIALDQAAQNAAMNAGDAQTLSLSMGDVERNVYAYGAKKGWSGQQVQAELRKANTSLISGVVSSLIADDRMDDAFSILVGNRARMDQKEYTRLYGMLKKDKDTKDDLTFVKGFYRADGTYDWDGARKAAVDKWGPNARRYVAGGYGGSFTGDSGLDSEIASAAQSENVEAALLAAVASEESGYDQSAVSPVGALGVMQLMPDTAAGLGVDPNDRAQNVRGGAKYLRQLLDRYHGNVELAVAAYNAGPGNVGNDETDGHIPQNGETPDYVARVMENYKANKEKQSAGGAGFNMMGGTYYDVNPGAEAQVEGLNGNTWQKLQAISYAYEQQFGERLFVTSGAESGGHNDGSKHYRGIAFDVAMDGLKQHPERRAWLMAHAGEYGLIPLDEYDEGGYEGYEHYDGYKSGENFHFSDNEEPFDASAVSASGGGGGHWESAYDPVRLEKAYKMIDAERAGAQSALQAKEDQYTDIIIGQIRDCGDGATAVSILESHRDDLTPSGYSKAKSAVSMYYAGAIPSARRGDWGSDGTRSGGSSASGSDKVEKQANDYLDIVDNQLGEVGAEGPAFHFKNDHTLMNTMKKLYKLRDSLSDDDPRKQILAQAIGVREDKQKAIWHSLPDDWEYDETYNYESGIDYGDDEEE